MDGLTGLADRTAFFCALREALDDARRSETLVGVLFIDLDGFKGVNDSLGHAAGDATLVETAHRMQSALGSQHVPARLGGDEFAVVLRGARAAADLEQAATTLEETLCRPFEWQGRRVNVGASVGLAVAGAGENSDRLLERADTAMYERKARRRGLQAGNVPPESDEFFGREEDLGSVAQGLREARALVVTGFGGMGKSRLAVRAARTIAMRFRDGIVYVDAGALTDGDLLVLALLRELRVNPSADAPAHEQLLEVLRSQERLIVLDNAERLRKAVTRLANMITAESRDSRLLITSREPLEIQGARNLTLQPLPEAAALALFTDRAQSVNARFALNEHNTEHVLRICRRLDGLPLAIELAAPRTAILSPEQILQRLTLGTTREAVLDELIQWHYKHLPEPYRYVFLCAGIFVGSFSEEALASVCGTELHEDVDEAVAALVSRSLLSARQTSTGQTRYRILSTIRDFAVNELKKDPQRSRALLQRHAQFFGAFAADAEYELRSSDSRAAMLRMDAEIDNFRAALAYYASVNQGQRARCVPMLAALGRYWYLGLHFSEGLYWFERLVDRQWEPTHELVQVLAFWSLFSAHRETLRKALALADDALAAASRVDSPTALMVAYNARGNVLTETGSWLDAAAAFSEVLAHARRSGEQWWIGAALVNRSRAFLCAGDFYRAEKDAQALADVAVHDPAYRMVSMLTTAWAAYGLQLEGAGALATAALDHAARSGEHYWEHAALELAALLEARGEIERQAYHEQHLMLARESDDRQGQTYGLIRTAAMLASARPEISAVALGSVQAAQRHRGVALPAMYRSVMQYVLNTLRSAMPIQRFEAAMARGSQLSIEDALAYTQPMAGADLRAAQ